jgi:uncharacterized Ntn-hydrolase superfamily protein
MTFSLSVRDDSGAFGIVICSSSPAVAARCVHLRAGVGAVASQNITNPHLGALALNALAADVGAASALEAALASERHRAHRQVVVVDRHGATAVHTGEHALGINHHVAIKGAAAAGNMLSDETVVEAMVAGFVDSPVPDIEGRLLDGLATAALAGGEAGPVRSAGLQVVDDVPWPVTDLRVDWHDDPVGELRRLWEVWAPLKQDYRTRGIDPTSAPSYGVPGDP